MCIAAWRGGRRGVEHSSTNPGQELSGVTEPASVSKGLTIGLQKQIVKSSTNLFV
jgi:hypothetical protein